MSRRVFSSENQAKHDNSACPARRQQNSSLSLYFPHSGRGMNARLTLIVMLLVMVISPQLAGCAETKSPYLKRKRGTGYLFGHFRGRPRGRR
jgi:hypothetical protein